MCLLIFRTKALIVRQDTERCKNILCAKRGARQHATIRCHICSGILNLEQCWWRVSCLECTVNHHILILPPFTKSRYTLFEEIFGRTIFQNVYNIKASIIRVKFIALLLNNSFTHFFLHNPAGKINTEKSPPNFLRLLQE